MSRTYRFTCLLALLIVAIFASAQDQAQAFTAKIRLDDRSMIIVPVRINGSQPYDFLLDTGCSKSIVDRKLANQLDLPRTAEKTVVGVLASSRMTVVHVDSLSLAGATVGAGEMFSSDHPATVTDHVRGVLGEDFLQNFDVFIDYRHHAIWLAPPLGSMARTATGEHIPMQLTGTYQGKPTYSRLIVSGRIGEFGDATMSLLLDSGANQLTLFKDNVDPGAIQTESVNAGNFNQWVGSEAAVRRVRSLDLGGSSVPDLTVIALFRRTSADSDGLIPTSLFHSIFISTHGGFVILNPSFADAGHERQEPKTER